MIVTEEADTIRGDATTNATIVLVITIVVAVRIGRMKGITLVTPPLTWVIMRNSFVGNRIWYLPFVEDTGTTTSR